MISTFPPHPAGASNYFDKLSCALSKMADVVALADIDSGQPATGKEPCYKIIKMWRPNSVTSLFRLFSGVLAIRPDVAHINHEYMLYGKPLVGSLFPLLPLFIRLAGIKVAITMHSVVPRSIIGRRFFLQYGGGKRLSIVKEILFIFVTKAIVACASQVIVHSQFSKQILVDDYMVSGNKIAVVQHGVPENVIRYDKREAKERLGLEGKKIILFFGFISRKKGLAYLVSAMPLIRRQHKNAYLIIAGGPYPSLVEDYLTYIKELEQLIEDLNLHQSVVLTKNYVPDDFLPLYFGAADVVVLPHVEVFGASGVLSLTMACAKPVVVTDHSIFTYYVKNGVSGLVVPRGDAKQLAEAIIKILSDKSLGLKLGRTLYKQANLVSWDRIAARHLELYSSLMRR